MPDRNRVLLKAQLRRQLVGRQDASYHYTRYEYSPMRLPMSELVLDEPVLGPEELHQHGLSTTPLLSLFGLYVHRASGTTVVRCVGKTSFAVDGANKYELQDVVVRSRRLELLRAGRCVAGQHFVGPAEGPAEGPAAQAAQAGTDACGRALVAEVRRLLDDVGGAPADETLLVPLLPVFLGHCAPDSGTRAVDLGPATYKRRLRALAAAAGRFVLFQEHADRRRQTLTQCGGRSVDTAVRHALAYRISGDALTRRVVRYLCRDADPDTYADAPVGPRAYALRGTKRSRLNHVLLRRSAR